MTTKCKECKGTGAVPDYMDCRNSSNNCCGGCDWVHKECPECGGYGEIETDKDSIFGECPYCSFQTVEYFCWNCLCEFDSDWKALDEEE